MRVVGQESIAELFGVAPKTIVEWQEAGFPIAQRGGPGVPSEYESADCVRWYVDREVKKVQAETPRDRVFRLQAEGLELDLAQKRGTLIPADSIEPMIEAAIVAAREKFLTEPSRLSMMLQGRTREDCEELLRTAFESFLTRLSRWRSGDEEDEG